MNLENTLYDKAIVLLDTAFRLIYVINGLNSRSKEELEFEEYMRNHKIDYDALLDSDAEPPKEVTNLFEHTYDKAITSKDFFSAIERLAELKIIKDNPKSYEHSKKMEMINQNIVELENQIAEIEQQREQHEKDYAGLIERINEYQNATGTIVYKGDDFEAMYAKWKQQETDNND